jgi:hypothetical protein
MMICEICGEWNHFYNVHLRLRAHCIAYQFTDYWLDGQVPTLTEARCIIESCHVIFNNEEFMDFCKLLKLLEDAYKQDENDGYKLFKLSKTTFEGTGGGRDCWSQLITIFAIATNLMNRGNVDLISNWLMHVLLENSSVWM